MKNDLRIIFLFPLLLIAQFTQGQLKKTNSQIVIGFYNCENFYDTINQANVTDEDFLPTSEKRYNESKYNFKATQLAKVLNQIGNIENANGIAIMGLVEIENKMVISKLTAHPLVNKFHYKFIHFDSKDARGVDVALIYNPAQFKPYQYLPYSLTDETHFNTYATRDILYVKGKLMNEWVHVLVNHWPSRRGGERSSASKRIWASSICKKIMDSVYQLDPDAKFIVMGDFNDNPARFQNPLDIVHNIFSELFLQHRALR
jgi:hypothetical protein